MIDHTLVIERHQLVLERGNYSTYFAQKKRRNQTAIATNDRLHADIQRLHAAKQQRLQWPQRAEGEKRHNAHADKGFIGAKAAKMMKKSQTMAHRLDQVAAAKTGLLQEVETVAPLTTNQQSSYHQTLLTLEQVGITLAHGTTVSLVRQHYTDQRGSLTAYAHRNHLPVDQLLNTLKKLGMERASFTTPLDQLSMGQQKKVELARSLLTPAQLYIWDEPLNYLDTYNQGQLIQLIQTAHPAMLIIEHDQHFIAEVATKRVTI